MADTVNLPTGTDGGVPIYNPTGIWQIWPLALLYQGQAGTNMYIGKVNDYVCDYTTNDWYKITALDATTYIPTLTPLTTAPNAVMTSGDLLQGVDSGTPADTFRCCLDTSVLPYVLSVDARCWFPNNSAAYIKIFTGADWSDNTSCISAYYNQSGTLVSQNIPLSAVSSLMPDGSTATVMVPDVAYTNTTLPNGTPVTAVAYTSTGSVVSSRQMLIWNTAFIRAADTSVKYVTGISLQCPYLSSANPTQIQFPVNVLLSSLNLMGIVSYSDGTTTKLPVDGTKFQIFGFDGFVSGNVGEEFELVLKYNLSTDEAVYGASSVANQLFINATYTAIAQSSDGAYSCKLYAFPVWIDGVSGYRLEWFLYDLDRTDWYDVTSLVTISANSPAFQPLTYGTVQTITGQVNLQAVDASYTDYNFTESVAITLLHDGTTESPWEVQFSPGQSPAFGVGNYATIAEVAANQYTIDLTSGYASQADWLTAMYYNTLPLTDPQTETAAPVPTHFNIQLPDGSEITCTLGQWNAQQTTTVPLTNLATIYVTFIQRTTTNDLQLSVAGVQCLTSTS
ncbi:hypothetical protein [Paraburkholderia sp. BCC1886]|uniref:hypothetical protein n=1 Tax=Paraburkholderia sp. BCC1886 TaxID=2562670 RepID=UPI0011846020|nr:hypothetical protein [Paraburkholderia sp. BCC1886]